jgi:hypothetical protein
MQSKAKPFVILKQQDQFVYQEGTWGQFHQPIGAKCKCAGRHSLAPSIFTNQTTPNFVSTLTFYAIHLKAACRTLMKLTPGFNILLFNIFTRMLQSHNWSKIGVVLSARSSTMSS